MSNTTWAPPTIPGTSQWAPPIPPPPPAPRRSRTGWIFLGVIAVLVPVGFVIGRGQTNTAGSSDTPASTSSGSVGKVVGTVTMTAWASLYGKPDADVLGADLGAISADATAMDVSGMAVSCRALQRHLATAEAHLPTPNAALTGELETSYGYFDQAATACISGAATLDPAAISRAGTYIGLGSASITRATAIVESLN